MLRDLNQPELSTQSLIGLRRSDAGFFNGRKGK
jgi:hypothetical protein